MRLKRISLSGFKGLDVRLPIRSAVVLFGRNDSGKTNILEGLEAALALGYDATGRRPPPEFPGIESDAPDSRIEFDLDGITTSGHPDQSLLVRGWIGDDSDEANEIRALIDAGHRWETPAERDDRIAEAVARITAREELPLEGYFVDDGRFGYEVPGGEGEADLGEVVPDDSVSLCPTVWMNDETGIPGWLYDRLTGYIAAELRQRDWRTLPNSRVRMAPLRRDDWLERDSHGGVRVRQEVHEICDELSESATQLAPSFVSSEYRIVIRALAPDEWLLRNNRRVDVMLEPELGDAFDIEVASAGIARWTVFALSEAMRTASRTTSNTNPTVYLVDEPEQHLHPLAHEEARRWLCKRTKAGAVVVIATHAAPFLQLPIEDVTYAFITRSTGTTTAHVVGDDMLRELREHAQAIGLPPTVMIQLTRAWLVVEGHDDVRVLEKFFGEQLGHAGVRLLALRGSSRAKASFLNLEALRDLGIPFFVMLDHVRRGLGAGGKKTEEEKVIEQVKRLADSALVHDVSHDLPDIFFALPAQALEAVGREHGRPQLPLDLSAYSGTDGNPKAWLRAQLGLAKWSDARLLDEVLAQPGLRLPDGSPLRRLINAVIATATNGDQSSSPSVVS
jgi:predicted ATPase